MVVLMVFGFFLLHSYIIQTQHNTHACCHQPRAVVWHIRVVFHRVYKTENALCFFYNIIFMLMSWLCVWLFFTHSLDYGFFFFFYEILHLFELSLRWCIKVCTLTEGYIDGKDGKLCCNFTHSESLNFRNLNIPVETQKIDVLQVLRYSLRYHPSQKRGSASCNQFFFIKICTCYLKFWNWNWDATLFSFI